MNVILVAFSLFIGMAAFCSAAEIIIITVNQIKLQHQKEEGVASAIKILDFLKEPDVLISAILVANNLAHVSCTALATLYFTRVLSGHEFWHSHIPLVTSVVVTPLILLLGEILPKNIGRRFPNHLIHYVYHPVRFSVVVFKPVLILIGWCTDLAVKVLGDETVKGRVNISREEFELMVKQSVDSGEMPEETQKLINYTFDFRETLAKEVMVPLMEIHAISIKSMRVEDFIEYAREYGFTRYPVYQDRIDKIIGFVNVYEVLNDKSNGTRPLKDFVRPLSYVPTTLPIGKLLLQMKRNFEQMVICVDEYGGCDGLVTIEDIIEELVGEIAEEHEDYEQPIVKIAPMEYRVDASMDIDDLNEELELNLPKKSYETLAGFLITSFERIPDIGERFVIENICFEILEKEHLALTWVKMTMLDKPDEEHTQED
jgi:CBS domain containing-hemolysin-like protein